MLWLPVLALLLAHAGVFLSRSAALMAFPFDLDQGEGYDVWSGWLINLGQSIYNDNSISPYYSSNYPPIYSYLISLPMIWLGPSIPAARTISVLATLAAAALVYAAVRQEGGRPLPAFASAALFLASNYVYHAAPLARVNALLIALSLWALLLLARKPEAGRATRWAGVAVLVLALFTKPTALDAAVAGILFLWLRRGSQVALHTGLALATAATVGLASLFIFSEGQFWTNVVSGNANPFDPLQSLLYLQNFGPLHAAMLGLATIQLVSEAASRRLSIFSLWMLTSFVTALAAGKWGAGESYYFGLIASSAVLTGKLASRVIEGSAVWPKPLIPVAMLAQTILFSHGALQPLLGRSDGGFQAAALAWEPTAQDVRAALDIAQRVRRSPDLVLSEEPGFMIAAGRPVIGNSTHLRNLWEAGLWSPNRLVADVQSQEFGLVILSAQLYPPPVLRAIGRHYYLAETLRVGEREYLLFRPGGQ